MIRRWHHGHSLGAGLAGGLALATYRVWLLLAAAFVLGGLTALVLPRLARIGARLGTLLDRYSIAGR